MNSVTEEQKGKLKEVLLSGQKFTTRQVSERTGISIPMVTYFKGLWGFTKKRRARNKKKTDVSAGKKEGYPTIAAFIAAYDQASVITKAILLTNVKGWVDDETKILNALVK